MLEAGDIDQLCRGRGWTRTRLIHALRSAAQQKDEALPADESLRRMVRQWVSGTRHPSPLYASLLADVFGVPFGPPSPPVSKTESSTMDELDERLSRAAAVDRDVIVLLQDQTQILRGLDRRLGAAQLHAETRAHFEQMAGLLPYATGSGPRAQLAAAVAQAASLAGWQALDMGLQREAWLLHEQARAAAHECGDPATLAHVTAQQACVLVDVDRVEEASRVVERAASAAGSRIPKLLRSWLWALYAETRAAAGDGRRTRRALERADALFASDVGDGLPFLFLDETHLARWRGHCLARLGDEEATTHLVRAAEDLDPSFVRAGAGLHCDLAVALAVAGDLDGAQDEVKRAQAMADLTTSTRQRRRAARILGALQGTGATPPITPTGERPIPRHSVA